MSTPTQTNLKLQLNLAELVQAKGLPIWESDLIIGDISKNSNTHLQIVNEYYPFHHRNLATAIDLNNNRFGQWLDKVFPKEVDPLSWKSYYAEDDSEVIATTAEYFKILIGCNGLTDNILKEIIQEIKLKPEKTKTTSNEPSK